MSSPTTGSEISGTPKPRAREILQNVDLTGRTAVITGASSGLGLESARALAGVGAHVVMAARRADVLAAAADSIRDEVPAARLSTVVVDLTSLARVRVAALAIAELAPVVDVLMNNAGVMFTPFGHTADGFETQFGTNHLGHFELTRRLTPQLRAAGGARVVNLSSEAHRLCDVDLDDPHWKRRDYDKFRAYGAAKTANILHAAGVNRRGCEDGIRACAVHPGRVATALWRHLSRAELAAIGGTSPGRDVDDSRAPEVLTPQQGAATQVWAAVRADPGEFAGAYFADCAVASAEPYATDDERAEALWELSARACDGTEG